jgi:MFS family permease
MVAAWSIGRGLFVLAPLIVAPQPFAVIVILHYLCVSIPVTGYVEVMREIYPTAMRGSLMAYVRVGFTATATILTPLAGQLLDVWGYPILFPIAALFGVMSGVLFGRLNYADAPAKTQHNLLDPWRVLWRDKRFRDYSIAFMLCGFGYLLITPLIPILLVDELHLTYGEIGFLGMVNSIFWMLFYIVWGRMVDRRGGLWTVQINLLLTTFISLALFFATNIWAAVIAYIVTGVTVAGTDLGWMNAIMQFARKDDVSDYTALHAFLVGLRGIVAPLLGTALMTIPFIGLRGVFLLSAFVILLGWWLMRYVAMPAKLEAG